MHDPREQKDAPAAEDSGRTARTTSGPVATPNRANEAGEHHPQNRANEASEHHPQNRANEAGEHHPQNRANEASEHHPQNRENEAGEQSQRDMLTPGSPFATATAADLLEGQGDRQAASDIREALARQEAARAAEQRDARLAHLRPLLAELLAACPGALAVALLTPGADSPLLLLTPEEAEGSGETQAQQRARTLCACFDRLAGGTLQELETAGAGVSLELALRAQHVDAALRRVDAGHHLLLLIECGDHLGRARYLLGRFAPRLSARLAASAAG